MSTRTRIGPAEDEPRGLVTHAVGEGPAVFTEGREPRCGGR